MESKKQIASPHGSSVELSLTPGANRLYCFFGGIGAGIAIPPFEFYRSAQILDQHKLFLRDLSKSWYHRGLPGVSTDLDSTAAYLDRQVQKLGPEQVFFVGNSMGGFAAMLFATLLGYGKAIAFAPQTFISPRLRMVNRDFRWQKKLNKAYITTLRKRRIWDLLPLMECQAGPQDIAIYASLDDRLDYLHAARVAHLPGVELHCLSGGGHKIVRQLRDEGRLPAILSDAA